MSDVITVSDDDESDGNEFQAKKCKLDKSSGKMLSMKNESEDGNCCKETCERCPLCQVPFSALALNSPSWHISECLLVKRNEQRECPMAYTCDSTIVSHYAKYTHYTIAKNDTSFNDDDENKATNPPDVNPMDFVEAVFDSNVVNKTTTECNKSPKKCDAGLAAPCVTQRNKKLIKGQQKITSFFRSNEPLKAAGNGNLKTDEDLKVISPNTVGVKRKTLDMPANEHNSSADFNGKVAGKCPFYKKMPDTPFVVDAFNYGDIPGVSAYFLSHFHSDHYCGLKHNFSHTLYCSQITANLVRLKIGVDASRIRILSFEEPTIVSNIEVDIIEAFHCPGAVMFRFRYPDGKLILHTGDFRYNEDMRLHPLLKNICFDILYLDTTYCNPAYEFPTQEDVVDYVVKMAQKHISVKPDTLIVCGAYCIGKEKVFMGLAKALNLKVCATKDKIKTLECLGNESINEYITSDWDSASIHVMAMGQLNPAALNKHLAIHNRKFSNLVAFKPTGWEVDKKSSDLSAITPKHYGAVTIYGVPYSEHSSFSELRQFVRFLKPSLVIPTVNVGTSKAAQTQQVFVKSWLT